ncbi:FixH family protein [Dyadobacter subterraneus]|uniref:FixH family protein n=1 Tax=Dyadobacter subterraneus TaxID=2773304 RepID=A0ABR9W5U1_9BACT|nr:FixH family protein [Dyadobacter subterraneus]MBE9460830.1 FixH family protein [Dyadobacter subterraneus]
MKINWGAGIAILYAGFVAMILLLVGMSASQKIDLVTDQYYEEELQFQNKINKVNLAKKLKNPLIWQVEERGIIIHYPEEFAKDTLTGNVKLYCPSDNTKDRNFPVKAKNNDQLIAGSDLKPGRYYLQIDWKNGKKSYWNEGVVVISKKEM